MTSWSRQDVSPAGSSGARTCRLELDVAGNPRRERVKLPSAIRGRKPGGLPHQKFTAVEDPVRRKVRTVSVAGPQASGTLQCVRRGFELFPAEVDFGVLREGCTYSVSVALRNVGIDSCRFSVKQPPPATGLRVIYTPGPVAAGMKTDLQVELYAVAFELEDLEGAGHISHHIQIQTETEFLHLPVTATVVPGGVSGNGERDCSPGRRGTAVRLVSTTPCSRRGIARPFRPVHADTDHTFLTQDTLKSMVHH
ncbi:sperm-associated antigen 17-like [Lepisosteus oculatus]|uniref:sperm-associated antigen 17-like n=1 Tax=Lepisosteus oculatus TaxID=7918 RepID=UPI0035F503C8